MGRLYIHYMCTHEIDPHIYRPPPNLHLNKYPIRDAQYWGGVKMGRLKTPPIWDAYIYTIEWDAYKI